MTTPILSLKDVSISFGGKALFKELDMHIYSEDRICLVGKNGQGKSTLMKMIANIYEPDKGYRWQEPYLKIGYLEQNMLANSESSVLDYVLSGFEKKDVENRYLAEMVIAPLNLEASKTISSLSGGQKRRASLAKAIVEKPDLLLLDEPTNHLDIESILWLESYIKSYKGAVLCVSHDRAFLANISNKTFWLDMGELRVLNKGYKGFEDWSTEILEREQRELENMERKMQTENVWLAQGVTARRKRNQRRLNELIVLRERLKQERSRMKKAQDVITLESANKQKASKIAIEFKDVNKIFAGQVILKNFNCSVLYGEKIGVIGYNGSGKTTFLRMIVGELPPDSGIVKIGKSCEMVYFDQLRSEFDPEKSVKQILCPSGNDQVWFRDRFIHVAAYLKRFLFDPKIKDESVATLSGGQINRLLLAKALANPGTLLMLDEPTNDLDMDTLDALQEFLAEYKGTLILVSHDRDFLDRTVLKTLAFEGDGTVIEVIGGYSDYIEYSKKHASDTKVNLAKVSKDAEEIREYKGGKSNKLTYKLQREYELLPKQVENLEKERKEIEQELANNELYAKNPDRFNLLTSRHTAILAEIKQSEEKWLEIVSMME